MFHSGSRIRCPSVLEGGDGVVFEIGGGFAVGDSLGEGGGGSFGFVFGAAAFCHFFCVDVYLDDDIGGMLRQVDTVVNEVRIRRSLLLMVNRKWLLSNLFDLSV